MIRTLGIGDNVCDKYLHEAKIYPGGNALNVALFSSMIGAKSAYLGTFGDDSIGKHVYETALGLGLDLSHSRFERGENGFARVLLIKGDRKFLKGNSGGISREKPPHLTNLDMDYISGFDVVHTSIYSALEDQLCKIKEHAAFLSMDFSDCKSEDYLKKCCPYIDCAEISCGDMGLEDIKEFMLKIKEMGCRKMVMATRGDKGAVLLVNKKFYEQSPNLIEVQDTMGAGDSFIACFLTNYIDGMKDCIDFNKNCYEAGITTAKEYEDLLIRNCLYRAAVFSAKQCQREGSFGYGKEFILSEEDKKLMKKSEGGSV